MIPTDVPLVYVCADGHRMKWSKRKDTYVHLDPTLGCAKPCIGAVSRTTQRPTLHLVKGGKC